jgi:voltage-gated potassium channel
MHPSKKKIGLALHRSRFLFLFLTIVLRFVLSGFLGEYVRANLLSAIFSSFILLFCVYSVSQTRRDFHIALGLAIPAFFGSWVGLFLKSFSLPIFGSFLQIIFLGFILLIIISHLFRLEEVTMDTILGAACSYFLIGLVWSLIFFVLESLSPGSFSFSRPHEEMNLNFFLYYSFMTMTTVGFGDITPLSDPARSLSVLEAVLGQLYMAITIAILVGSYLSRGKRSSASG